MRGDWKDQAMEYRDVDLAAQARAEAEIERLEGARHDPASADLDIGSVPSQESIERLRLAGEAAQQRIDRALRMAPLPRLEPVPMPDELGPNIRAAIAEARGYKSALDRPDGPAPAPDQVGEWIEEARSALAAARAAANRSGDPRLQGITASLMHLEELQS